MELPHFKNTTRWPDAWARPLFEYAAGWVFERKLGIPFPMDIPRKTLRFELSALEVARQHARYAIGLGPKPQAEKMVETDEPVGIPVPCESFLMPYDHPGRGTAFKRPLHIIVRLGDGVPGGRLIDGFEWPYVMSHAEKYGEFRAKYHSPEELVINIAAHEYTHIAHFTRPDLPVEPEFMHHLDIALPQQARHLRWEVRHRTGFTTEAIGIMSADPGVRQLVVPKFMDLEVTKLHELHTTYWEVECCLDWLVEMHGMNREDARRRMEPSWGIGRLPEDIVVSRFPLVPLHRARILIEVMKKKFPDVGWELDKRGRRKGAEIHFRVIGRHPAALMSKVKARVREIWQDVALMEQSRLTPSMASTPKAESPFPSSAGGEEPS